MAWIQSDIDALKSAIRLGVKTVVYADRTVTYHSVDDMLKLLSAMEAEVSTSTSGRSTLASFPSE